MEAIRFSIPGSELQRLHNRTAACGQYQVGYIDLSG